MRDSKLRLATPGVEFTDSEKASWRGHAQQFFNPTPKEQKRIDKCEKITIPRLATFDWLVSLDNALRIGTNKGLERFGNVQEALMKNELPATLVLCVDQHQMQWTGIHFLQHGPPKLCLVALFDGFHRRHNDLWQAMERSGTVGQFVCKMLELSMSYGPWQSSAWMRTLEDGAMDVSQLFDVNDPLLLRMWPGICKDMEFDDTESQGPEARAAFLKDLPHFPVFNNKGPKASTSRWMSWQASVRFHDRYHHTKLLVALYVAIKKEWVRSADDLWSEGAGQQQAAVGAGGPGATASTSSAPTVKRNTRPLAVVAATQNGKFPNTFTAVLKSMANPDLLTGARMIALLTAGEEKAHARVATEMRSADRTVEFYSDWAQCSWVHPLREAIRVFLDPLQLRRIGFTVSFSGPQFAGLLATDPRVGYEDVLAELCVKYLKEFVAFTLLLYDVAQQFLPRPSCPFAQRGPHRCARAPTALAQTQRGLPCSRRPNAGYSETHGATQLLSWGVHGLGVAFCTLQQLGDVRSAQRTHPFCVFRPTANEDERGCQPAFAGPRDTGQALKGAAPLYPMEHPCRTPFAADIRASRGGTAGRPACATSIHSF